MSPDGLTPGTGETFNFMQGSKDGDQIAELIDFFRERFAISNVYLYGHSQGAFFCYWFVGAHPERVDGIVAHAGNVLDVQHPKLAKENVAIGILHARSDQVVPVDCAERTRAIYEEQGYSKLRCWIVEDIRPQAGHWPLPQHVSEMFEWLDEVCTRDAAHASQVAWSALERDPPDVALAARVVVSARASLRGYDGDDEDAVEARIEAVERIVAEAAGAGWSVVAASVEASDDGRDAGAWCADLRWLRRTFGENERFIDLLDPVESRAKKHDRAFTKLAKIDDRTSKKYAKALLDALEDGYLALEWDARYADAAKRVEEGWRPDDDFEEELRALGLRCGTTRTDAVADAVHGAAAAERDAVLAAHSEGEPDRDG